MDLSVNKPAKSFLKRCFEQWYLDEIIKQFNGKDIESTELESIGLNLTTLKELMAKWLVEMADYFAENPLIIVNGFMKAGITPALDGDFEEEEEEEEESEVDDEEEDDESDMDYDSEMNDEEVSDDEDEIHIVISDED